jgi:hypothetical protein
MQSHSGGDARAVGVEAAMCCSAKRASESIFHNFIRKGLLPFSVYHIIVHTANLPTTLSEFFHNFPVIQVVPVFIRIGDSKPVAAPDIQADQLIHFRSDPLS